MNGLHTLFASRAFVGAVTALAAWAMAPPATSQIDWTQAPVLGNRRAFAMAYHAKSDHVVLFGGSSTSAILGDTWTWDGAKWERKSPATSPPARDRHAMAYDGVSNRVILFGGFDTTCRNDTWAWDGADWTLLTPGNQPPARCNHAMAYDAARGTIVLFGGSFASLYGDTWVWDGANWMPRSSTPSPAAQSNHAMAYDPVRQRTVLFSGLGVPGQETWEWDGVSWAKKLPATSPSGRSDAAMAYDAAAGRILLFGGFGGSQNLNDTWLYDGANWVQTTPGAAPPARSSHAMVYDSGRGEAVVVGGHQGPKRATSDTWTRQHKAQTWTRRNDGSPPAWLVTAATDTAGGGTFLYAVAHTAWVAESWTWNGTDWTRHDPGLAPPARRFGPGLAGDTNRGRVTLFGGGGASGIFNDTWEWNGTSWTLFNVAVRPIGREWTSMAFDPERNRVVLFGGQASSGPLSDTWEWTGTAWMPMAPPVSPPARWGHALAWDPMTGRVLLFGGSSATGPLHDDTWTWDGTTWTPITIAPVNRPPARYLHSLTEDRYRGRVVLFGGADPAQQRLADTWDWDGVQWISRMLPSSPAARAVHGAAFDASRNRVVVFGGDGAAGGLDDTWELGPVYPASYQLIGTGCPGSAGVPSLEPPPSVPGGAPMLPWIGESFVLWLFNLPPGQPVVLAVGTAPQVQDLTPFGMPGCTLYLVVNQWVPLGVQPGNTTWGTDIPNDPALLGGSVFHQLFVSDPGVNPASLTVSNAGGGVIGGK